jgi:hypothetical protein
MARNVKALRVVALLAAVSGASMLVLSSASTPAKASEERLHNESLSTYGLLPPGATRTASAEGGDSMTTSSFAMSSAGIKSPSLNKSKEPDIEDPALPGYDGPDAPASSARSAVR